MLQTLTKRVDREERGEEGFTLIELMVVVLIIAILLAIAIPTFLGARDRANDRAAQSSLRNALTAAKVIFTDQQDYTQATTTNLEAEEPNLQYVAAGTPSTDFKMVSIATTANEFAAAALSETDDCFLIRDNAATGGGTFYGETTPANCTGTFAITAGNVTATDAW